MPRCASNRFPAGGAFRNASGFRPHGSPFRADAPAVDAGGQGLRHVARRTGARLLGSRRPGVGVRFLVSMALAGAAVAVIVPIAIGYTAGHGEDEYAGHVRNRHARQRPPQRHSGACCQIYLGSENPPIIAVRGSRRYIPAWTGEPRERSRPEAHDGSRPGSRADRIPAVLPYQNDLSSYQRTLILARRLEPRKTV